MTDITKHDGKQEREGDDGEKTRVDFTITCNAISINNILESFSELVGTMIRWWCLFGDQFCEDGRQVGTR